MKVYELKKGDRFKVIQDGVDWPILIFERMDGAYSYSKTDDGEVVNVFCGAPLEIVHGER